MADGWSFLWLLLIGACLSGRVYGNEPESAAAATPSAPGDFGAGHAVDFWRTEQGLPHNTVNAVLQTRDSYLWVGTAAGLARFDGLAFTVLGDESASGLKAAAITALLEDHEGALWVGTQGRGVFRLRRGQSLRFTTAEGLADNSVTSLVEDGSGCVWIGTQGGLNQWNKKVLSRFTAPLLRAGDSIVALRRERSGALWVTTASGVFCLKHSRLEPFKPEGLPQSHSGQFVGVYEDRSGNLWGFGATFLLNLTQGRRFNYFRSLELTPSSVWTFCEQGDGDFWIGTSGRGLFRFQGGRFEVAGVQEGLDQCDVRALFVDGADNLWIGTRGNGLVCLHAQHFRFIGASEGLNSQAVSAIVSENGDQLWVGTRDCGLLHWDGRRMEPVSGASPLGRLTQIQSLCLDGHGALWVGTWGAGLWQVVKGRQRCFRMEDGMSDDVVQAVAADPHSDAIWAGTREGSLHRLRDGGIETFTTADGLSGNAILCLLAGEDGSLLIGSEAGGLLRWDGKAFAPIPVPPDLMTNPIRCLFHDRNGRLWAGTWGAGAFCRQGHEWIRLSVRQGLASDEVGQISQDEAGDFWFGTEENLFKVRGEELESYLCGGRQTVGCVVGIAEIGAANLKCPAGWPNVICLTNGDRWVATSSGLLPMAARSKVVKEAPPPVIIEQVLVNGQQRTPDQQVSLRLGPNARSLDFVFTAVNFTAPQKIQFRHKLENFDADWVDGGLARRAHYGPLPPGQYRFHVIAANANGIWNEVGVFQPLVVVPAVWRSWWFLTMIGMVAAGGVWAAARFISVRRLQARLRIAKHQHAMERERARIARDMHDEIGSKLTRISFLSEVARNPQAEIPASEQIDAIASTSRELLCSLDEIVWAVNPRNDTLEQLVGYLEAYAREYFQSLPLECEILVPARLPPVPLSAEVRHNVFLAFKEALNNVLKHAQATRVGVAMSLEKQSFEIRVRDNGRGFGAGSNLRPEQDGLLNMREHLRSMGGICEITSQPGCGATVHLRFPLETPNAGPGEKTTNL